MKKNALITGINGQDGSYLSEFLLEKNYEVWGTVKRNSVSETQSTRIEHLRSKDLINLEYADLTDMASLVRVLQKIQPDEIYNLAAQSHVRISFDQPVYTANATGIGVLNLLEAVRMVSPSSKIYQASSSEMFGNNIDIDGFQRETSIMNPVSPYGCSKVLGYNLIRHYRHAYGLHACNGILFNHESPRRGSNFVTNKVIKTAVAIKKGLENKLELGNMDSSRDWGHSKDYVRAMHMIINHKIPDDFIISTGESHSVRELCEVVFNKLGMDYKEFVVQNPKYMRPEELRYLKGDSTKSREVLGWQPEYTFDSMIDEMIQRWEQEL